MIQRHTPLKRTPLKKQSKKRAKESRIYLQKRKAFLEKHPVCQVWLKENGWSESLSDHSTKFESAGDQLFTAVGLAVTFGAGISCDIHHKSGRTGKNYLDESTWLACSREAHRWIHEHPKEAGEKGYLI